MFFLLKPGGKAGKILQSLIDAKNHFETKLYFEKRRNSVSEIYPSQNIIPRFDIFYIFQQP